MSPEFNGLLTATVFLPAAGAVLMLLLRGNRVIRGAAVAIAVADLVLALLVFALFERSEDAARFQFVDQFAWIPDVGLKASYLLAVDGLSAPMVALTGLLGLSAVLASWHVGLRVKEYFFWLLLLQSAVMGVFTALDLLLFFLFWELELVPMFMLISIWGTGRKEYSAMKFLIFTILGSAFMLVAIVAVFLTPDVGTFNLIVLSASGGIMSSAATLLPLSWLFWLFFVGFAVKLPTWPLHTWLPDAHTDAPTAASVMLAGVLLKMGGYGLLRINVGLFPTQSWEFAWVLVILGVVSILYGAVVTIRQTDLKRLIAYSSVSHMGLVLLGIGSVGVAGGNAFLDGPQRRGHAAVHPRNDHRPPVPGGRPGLREGAHPIHSGSGRAWPEGCHSWQRPCLSRAWHRWACRGSAGSCRSCWSSSGPTGRMTGRRSWLLSASFWQPDTSFG